jgi:cystathionine beta-lyase/cystathionine gamma-synthase
MRKTKKETEILHAWESVDLGKNIPDALPIYPATAFSIDDLDHLEKMESGQVPNFQYARSNTPNHTALAGALALAEEGEAAVVTAAGMAAIYAAITTAVRPGEHVIVSDYIYSETLNLFRDYLPDMNITYDLVDLNDQQAYAAAFRDSTRLVVTEILTNPTLKVIDLAFVIGEAHRRGARVMVDNTFTTPVLLNPLKLGADIVVHSCTKFINGHNDAAGGVIVADAEFVHRAKERIVIYGSFLSPHDAWLIHRSMKTMSLRVERQCENAAVVAGFLQDHAKVRKVFYPGLDAHPGHHLAAQMLQNRFGAILSFDLGDERETIQRFIRALEIIRFVPTLGGVKTTLSYPAVWGSVLSLPPGVKETIGITDGLLRLSVGIEHRDDLLADLEQALQKI